MTVTLASVDGTWTNANTYDAAELRRADAALFASAGITTGLAVSVDGSDVVTVTAGQAVISGEDAVTGTGVYRAGIGSSVTGSLEARDATNSRIDLVVFRQYDTDVVGSHGKYASEIEIIKGTPSATPAVPTKPSMAVELARITVPQAGGGAASVDSTHRAQVQVVGTAPSADTGWLDITLSSGYAHVSGDTGQVRMISRPIPDGAGGWSYARHLYFRGSVRRTSGTGTAVGELPASITLARGLSTMIRVGTAWMPWIIAANRSLVVSSAVVTGDNINLGSAAGANGMLLD